jgi:hypothetical protein
MSSRSARLSEALERVQQRRAEAELLWLRRARLDQDWLDGARALLTEESAAEFSDAQRERVWSLPEQRAFVAQRAQLAFEVELAEGRPLLSKLVQEPFTLPFGREAPAALVSGLTSDGNQEGREQRARALTDAAGALTSRLLELRVHALAAYETQLASSPEAPRDSDSDRMRAPALPPGLAEEPPPAPLSATELASEFLANTDDATREMTRWIVRPEAMSGTIPWHVLLRALRAPSLDGLAKPARRVARIANGLRSLGFERDLNARVRAESAEGVLDPRVRVIAQAVPSDIRIVQAKLTHGVMSDIYAAHGVGHGLALALVSPALPDLLRRPTVPGVAEALGMTFMQLRADPEYLRREGLEPLWVEKLGRHAGILLLLEVRVQAALSLIETQVRRESDRSQQLTAAFERALGAQIPEGLATLLAWAVPPGTAAFETCAAGLAAQVGLRERFDADWYRNPRVSEVLRGAAMRGTTLSLPALLDELGVPATAAIGRAIELLE